MWKIVIVDAILDALSDCAHNTTYISFPESIYHPIESFVNFVVIY